MVHAKVGHYFALNTRKFHRNK